MLKENAYLRKILVVYNSPLLGWSSLLLKLNVVLACVSKSPRAVSCSNLSVSSFGVDNSTDILLSLRVLQLPIIQQCIKLPDPDVLLLDFLPLTCELTSWCLHCFVWESFEVLGGSALNIKIIDFHGSSMTALAVQQKTWGWQLLVPCTVLRSACMVQVWTYVIQCECWWVFTEFLPGWFACPNHIFLIKIED